MKRRAGIIGTAVAGLALSAQAYVSAYTSMAVPGTHNGWATTASMVLKADNVWVCTQSFNSVTGEFKFAANNGWAVNWGGNFTLLHLPAYQVGSLSSGGANLTYTGIATGQYVVTFYESTATFDLVPVVPAANPVSMQLIGSFNGDGATSVGTMTNTAGYLWETAVDLDAGADFLFRVGTASATNDRGAMAATSISTLPYSGGNPAGAARYALNVATGGTFTFTFDALSNRFGIVRNSTNTFSLASVTAVGDFVAGSPPDINLEKISRTVWRSEFNVTNASRFTLSFIGRNAIGDIGRFWGLAVPATNSLPATGFMLSSSNAIYTNLVVTAAPGNYRITFDSNSGEYVVQQRYTAASGINYLQNPSFESLDFNYPANWGCYHAAGGEQADFGAHSGARCGVLMAKTDPNDMDLGSFDQTTQVFAALSGQTFRVSAAFRTKGDWQADTVRIIVEWWRTVNSSNVFVREDSAEVVGLSEEWTLHALEASVPSTNVWAKVLLKYDGVPGTGFLLVDDAEARIAAARYQNFDGWSYLSSFSSNAPDWAVTSGKTIYNQLMTSPTGGIVVSKYVEGSGNNKAIEIFNGSGAATNLLAGQYVLQQYNNGATAATVTIALTNVLDANQCLIVSRAGTPTNAYPPAAGILTAGGQKLQTNALTFNGDDVIVLRRGGAAGPIVDRVGQAGTNAARSVWRLATTDRTLHRKHTVFWGTTNAPSNSFSLAEWTLGSKDDLSELGIHYFSVDDPDAPYLPSGYSLLLNTNASLMSPELEGGIGDLTFYARAQGSLAGNAIQLAIETSTSQTSTNWTTTEIISVPLNTTNFTLFSSYANQSAHTVLRIRHVGDGTTNRIRLDDVRIGEAYAIKRSENFAAWTNYLGNSVGTYGMADWTIQNAQINTNGLYGSVAADVYPETGTVTSPTFEGGVGTVKFWLSQHPQDRGEIAATVYTSTNGGNSWISNGTVRLPAPTGTNVLKTNATVAAYFPVPSSARISAAGSPSPFVVDNVEVAIPSQSRTLTFDDFKLNTSYTNYTKDGWTITETSIVTNPVYSGYAGRMRNATITSPYVDEIGGISFYYQLSEFGGDNTARLAIDFSADGSSWTTVQTDLAPPAAPTRYSFLNTNANYRYARIRQTTSGARILIDQIDIGEPTPIPTCTVSVALSPLSPAIEESFYVVADVIPSNEADILAVTGSYRTNPFASWINLPMAKADDGSYRSTMISPMAAGTRVYFKASALYAGTGAAPGSSTYTSNTAYSATNSIYISDVEKGTVWINELFYGPYEGEEGGGFWGDPYEHEYIELCGVAGTSITNWKVELLFASPSDVSKNGGQAKYATYAIPAGTVLSNSANGFGFYVIGDHELAGSHPVNQDLTTLVPTNVMPDNPGAEDHIHDASGIVRLLDNYSNVVYSLSYGAYDSGSEKIPAQSLTSNTNSLSLVGDGSAYDDFSWATTGALTPGIANTGQSLTNLITALMGVWHTPAAVARTSLQGVFSQFHPMPAAQSDALFFHYAYTNGAFSYAVIDGRVHHRLQGDSGAWKVVSKQNDFPGNFDTNGTGYAYLRMGPITNYAYDRLDTIEYVIEAVPNQSGLGTAWLGSDGAGSSTAYASLDEAKANPFQYTFPIADVIEIYKFTRTNNLILLETDGNDPQDPIASFNVRFTTNLALPIHQWDTLPIVSVTRTNELNYFSVTNPPITRRFLAVQPLWP